jgi:hypothetical protein
MPIDDLALLYNIEVTAVLDRLLPERTVRCRRRPSDPWFDEDCRLAKRQVRRLERAARKANSTDATAAWKQQRRVYRDLLRQKRESFWTTKVDCEQSNPNQLWKSIDALMGRGRIPVCTDIAADEFHQFFVAKVDGVRATTSNAPPASFTAVSPGCTMNGFVPLSIADVTTAVRQLPDKQCEFDPMPTSLLKSHVDVFVPYLTELFNISLSHGIVPSSFKSAYITPLIKKSNLDPADVKSYRPISNLSVVSKLLERLIARQLISYLISHRLLPDLQSAYRAHHSTETAVLKVLSDILLAVDSGDLSMLTLLDLSAAFDTVDHVILLQRLQHSYGLQNAALGWFQSYLTDRTQFVRHGGRRSVTSVVVCGVPQGSVLGPILFLLYTADLIGLIESFGLHSHLYADDTQIYGSCRPDATGRLTALTAECLVAVARWMQSNRLQLNTAKTEVLWCTSARRQYQLPRDPLPVGADQVSPVTAVRNLGIYLDADLSMRTHVVRTASACFAVLRNIRSIRRSVSQSVLESLVVTLVLTRLDYGGTTLTGLPKHLLDRLQSVQNAAARLIFTARRCDHVTPLLRNLHWLKVPERISYRLAVLVYRCLHGTAPDYLASQFRRASSISTRQRLRSASTTSLVVKRTKRVTIGDRSFSVAAASTWNSLPESIRSSSSLSVFRKVLKTELFKRSFPAD